MTEWPHIAPIPVCIPLCHVTLLLPLPDSRLGQGLALANGALLLEPVLHPPSCQSAQPSQ